MGWLILQNFKLRQFYQIIDLLFKVVLRKFREDDDEQFAQVMFKVIYI